VDVYRTEEEQVEALQKWWKENGNAILIGAALAIAGYFGWEAWQKNQVVEAEAASNEYFNFLQAVEVNSRDSNDANAATVLHLGDKLKSEYGQRVYGHYAGLMLAKMAVQENDLAKAETELQWVVDNAKQGSSVYLIANLRLARVIYAQGGADNDQRALALIENVEAGGHQASYEEVKGDIYVRMGRLDQARTAYGLALEEGERVGAQRQMVRVKLDDLAQAATSGIVEKTLVEKTLVEKEMKQPVAQEGDK